MNIVKRAALLLLLLLPALCTDAAPTAEECDGLIQTLPTKDLHTIFQDWVLVWSVSDDQRGLVGNLSSSHVELRLLPDNKSIVYFERNMFLDKSCTSYLVNMSMASDADHLKLTVDAATVEKDGVVRPYNESGSLDFYKSCSDCLLIVYRETAGRYLLSYTVEKDGVVRPYNESGSLDFYKSCSDCLLIVYRETAGRYLLSYRREGHHGDVEQLKAAHSDHKKQAECLRFTQDQQFSYDGAADFCHKKSSAQS